MKNVFSSFFFFFVFFLLFFFYTFVAYYNVDTVKLYRKGELEPLLLEANTKNTES